MKKMIILAIGVMLSSCSPIAASFNEQQNLLLSEITVNAHRMIHSCPALKYADIDSQLKYKTELFSTYSQNLSNNDEFYKASQLLDKMVGQLENQYKDPKSQPSPAYCVDKLMDISNASARLLRAEGSLE